MPYGWIGLTDQSKPGDWRGPNLERVTYFAWANSQPEKNNEHCAAQHSNKQWHDHGCQQKKQFICQISQGNHIKEIKFGSGLAGATSFLSDNWKPDNAFKHNLRVGKGWHTGPADGHATPLPAMIWYDFKTEIYRPAEISFQPAQDYHNLQRSPTSYQFVGSNEESCDDYSAWTVLCEDLSGKAWRDAWEVRYCKVKPEMTWKFRCLGVRVLANHAGLVGGWTTIRNIRMWERI